MDTGLILGELVLVLWVFPTALTNCSTKLPEFGKFFSKKLFCKASRCFRCVSWSLWLKLWKFCGAWWLLKSCSPKCMWKVINMNCKSQPIEAKVLKLPLKKRTGNKFTEQGELYINDFLAHALLPQADFKPLSWLDNVPVVDQINYRGWQSFSEKHSQPCVDLVHEFYTNLKWQPKEHLCIPEVAVCECSRLYDGKCIDFDVFKD